MRDQETGEEPTLQERKGRRHKIDNSSPPNA
jgi:hypothetical protein